MLPPLLDFCMLAYMLVCMFAFACTPSADFVYHHSCCNVLSCTVHLLIAMRSSLQPPLSCNLTIWYSSDHSCTGQCTASSWLICLAVAKAVQLIDLWSAALAQDTVGKFAGHNSACSVLRSGLSLMPAAGLHSELMHRFPMTVVEGICCLCFILHSLGPAYAALYTLCLYVHSHMHACAK